MQLEIFLLGFAVCLVTFIPLCYVLVRLVCVFNQQTIEKRPRLHGQVLLVGLTAVMFVLLYGNAHNDTFIGLDTSCYRQLATIFSEEARGLDGVDTIYKTIPPRLQKNFLYRNDVRPTRDRIFQMMDSEGTIEPYFLPKISLGASILPDIDLLVPLCGALWFASLIAFSLCKAGLRGVTYAVGCFFATFWPMWFLRGFYSEAIGSILISSALLASLIPQLKERKLDILVIGFMLGCSVGYHFTMIVPAGVVALYLLLTNGWTSRRLLWLILGGAIGLIPMLYQLLFICTPYGNILSISAFANMLANVKEIRFLFLALLCAIIVFVGFAVIILNQRLQQKIHYFLDKNAAIINPILIVASALVWLVYAFFAGPITAGFFTIKTGLFCALPLIILCALLFAISKEEDSVINSALVLMLSLMAALFVYIKGVEIHVGLWSQRRFFPVVVMFLPLLIVALCSFKGNGKTKFLPYGLLMISIVPMFRWPAAYFGVYNASRNEENGKPTYVDQMNDFIDKYNNEGKNIFIFDRYSHSVPFQHDLSRFVLGVGEHCFWNYPEVVKWAFETSKTNKTEAFFISSYGYPMLEEGVALRPICTLKDEYVHYTTKGVFPIASFKEKSEINSVILLMEEPTRNSKQYVSLATSVYSFGLRQPWGKTTRQGTWSRQGSGVVGPIPENGGKVDVSISAMWFPPINDGSWAVQNLIIEAPFGEKKTLQISSTNEFSVYSCEIERQENDDFGDSVTGVYRFYVEKPFDPALYGTRGFDKDLGVNFQHISIKCVE